ncbi:hypothetical protein GCM10010390_50940 [Streptomyces mordarskii]|uniref:Uncharacterized protein n=1 Tax=Streptomyces mordarskii TaxID=1226758 RepID=A0ABN1DGD7_9ACTN
MLVLQQLPQPLLGEGADAVPQGAERQMVVIRERQVVMAGHPPSLRPSPGARAASGHPRTYGENDITGEGGGEGCHPAVHNGESTAGRQRPSREDSAEPLGRGMFPAAHRRLRTPSVPCSPFVRR